MLKFSAKIFKIGINPVVDPPDEVREKIFEQAGRSRGPIPFRGKLDEVEFIQTLVKYQGAWRLYINAPMLKASGLYVGDTARIEIEYDPRPREFPVPDQLANALERDEAAKEAYESLSASRRKEIVRYLGSLKTEESLTRNVERVLRHLLGEKADKLHALMRTEKQE